MRKTVDESFENLLNRNIKIVDTLPNEKSRLKKTIISGVELSNLNDVVKLIINGNSDILIYKIYYCENFKQLVFLANEKLDVNIYKMKIAASCKKSGKKGFAIYLMHILDNCENKKVGEASLSEIKELYTFKTK